MRCSRIVLLVVLAIGSTARAEPTHAQPARAPIPIADVRARGVLGELGEPLGAIVTIACVVVDGDTLQRKDALGSFYVRVTRVGARELPSPVMLKLSSRELQRGKLAPGPARVIGYETGGFVGAAPREFDYVDAYATIGWYFETRFVPLKLAP